MAGPLDIQRAPSALLDLLGLKGSGRTPVALRDEISATLADCADYYLAPRRTTINAVTAGALTANSSFTLPAAAVVPATEVWFCYAVSFQLTTPTAAASSIRFWGWLRHTQITLIPWAITNTAVVGAVDNEAVGRQYERPLLLMPGDVFGFATGAATGVPGATGTFSADVAKLSL